MRSYRMVTPWPVVDKLSSNTSQRCKPIFELVLLTSYCKYAHYSFKYPVLRVRIVQAYISICDSVRKRTQHGDSNTTEIRCTKYIWSKLLVPYSRAQLETYGITVW